MSKYPISKEFGFYAKFTTPIRGPKMAGWMGSMMKPPKWFHTDDEMTVTKKRIPGYCGEEIEVSIVAPKGVETDNCLVLYHGGGFFFAAAEYHYRLAKAYAVETPCKVILVDYRLAPKYPFPVPGEDCYGALVWTMENAASLGVDREKIAVGGDSAGGCLAAAVTMMARDRIDFKPRLGISLDDVITDREGLRKVLKCRVFPLNYLPSYKYTVICSNYKGKWILSKHKKRDTWETQGGHIEDGEMPLEAAKRELFEESGTMDADVYPVCDYWGFNPFRCSNGMVFLAVVHSMGELPESEMQEIGMFEELPENLTYPQTSPVLYKEAEKVLKSLVSNPLGA